MNSAVTTHRIRGIMPFFKTPWLHHNVACSFSKRSFLLRFGINVASPLADGSIAVQASAPILARCPAHAARLVRTLALPCFAIRQAHGLGPGKSHAAIFFNRLPTLKKIRQRGRSMQKNPALDGPVGRPFVSVFTYHGVIEWRRKRFERSD